jgi:hypothetical protein
MLEVRKNTFSKNYENSFFREFSRHLYNSFKEKNLTGVLIGSPLCEVDERLQIDALLITPSVVCIIDFKNFKGKVKLPAEKDFEYGLWTKETGEQIKGGSSINPFIQLKNQKRRFVEVSNKHIQKHISKTDTFNPYHLVRAVCFQEEIELAGKIPANEALNFFILNRTNFIEGILDIVDVTDKEVNLSESSFDAFKKVFRADKFKFDNKPLEDKLKYIESKSTKQDYGKLYDDQKAALTEIKSFLENPEQQVFVLQGTTNSGKSFLIPFIQELAYSSAIQETEIFAASGRIVRNLLSSSGVEKANSIYSFIYGGHKTEKETEEKEEVEEEVLKENEEQETTDYLPLEIVPLKKCDNSDNVLFIVDESQLVSDSYHQSVDLMFGSGYLLKDFLTFTDFASSKRKIVFIGDPYQLQLGKTEESPLNPAYLEETYKMKVTSFQLLDKEQFSDINKQSLRCVGNIKTKLFNSLRFTSSEQFSLLNKNEITPYVINLIDNNVDGHILAFSNEESQKVNYWIKKSIIKTGEDIAARDLVLFNNNIEVEDENDPFAQPKNIYNGQFATVEFVAEEPYLKESRKFNSELTTLIFRNITLRLNETNHQVKVLSLENFHTNSKAELSKNELSIYKSLLKAELSKAKKASPFNNSQEYSALTSDATFKKFGGENNQFVLQLIKGTGRRKDLNDEELYLKKLINDSKSNYRNRIEKSLRKNPSTQYYRLKNAAQLRFGWAMTIDKSASYKWKEVMINTEPGSRFNNSKTHEPYFRMLYTGLSRARQKVNLINYNPISPFENTEMKNGKKGVKPKDIFFVSDNPSLEERLIELDELISAKTNSLNFKIKSDKHSQYQMLYTFQDGSNTEAVLSIYFKDNGRFNFPTVMSSRPKEFGETVIEVLKKKKPIQDFSFIKDEWRRNAYTTLNNVLANLDVYFELILQTNYKDKIKFYTNENELDIELNYGGDGMVSIITAKFYSNISIWEDFQKAIEQIKK